MSIRRAVLRPWLALGFLLLAAASPGAAATVRRSLEGGMRAAITDRQEIFLEAPAQSGEGMLAFSRRLTGTTRHARELTALNGRPRRLLRGQRYRVPYALLRGDLQVKVALALFTADRATTEGWIHRVDPKTRGQSLWHVAEWFTGRGENFAAIRRHNRLPDDEIHPGQELAIPAELLLGAFRAALPDARVARVEPPPQASPPPPAAPPAQPPEAPIADQRAAPPHLPPPEAARYALDYARQGGTDYAVYRLARGEALYSSVVVRFTGRTIAEDVNRLAAEIASLNGIADVTDIPVGRAVRIPFDLLTPEFLPEGNPRREEYEQVKAEAAKYGNTVRAARLEGITVVLDAGHGGVDPGALRGDVWESVHVYDIMLRLKQILETTTAARVVPTVRDGNSFRLIDRDVLPPSRGHSVLTTPAYPIREPKVGTNLRWYLANSVHRQVERSTDDGKIVFLSIHADSRHPSMRGAMAYVPATSLRQGTFGRSTAEYTRHKEVREQPRVSFSWKERTRSEGLSRQLAEKLVASFRRHGLRVPAEQPIRDRVVRSRNWVYVPAVLRYNQVPAKVLFEVANMNNTDDRRLLQTRSFRQLAAQAIADAILDYYGEDPGAPAANVAAR